MDGVANHLIAFFSPMFLITSLNTLVTVPTVLSVAVQGTMLTVSCLVVSVTCYLEILNGGPSDAE